MSFELDRKWKAHNLGGGKGKQEQQRKKGKLNAFERTDAIFDPGTFIEIDPFVLHDCNEFGLEDIKKFSEME
jgi:propionyl-CoA carboxylase beta chain